MSDDARAGMTLTTSTIQFLIQLGVLLAAICGFGYSIQNTVQVQGVRMEVQKEQIDSLERKIELLRYDLSQMQLDLASKGVLVTKEKK